MPSIKDKSTVEAIAREFTSNGRNKSEALKTIGYKASYCNTRGLGVVYGNVRIIEAIARIDAETRAKSIYTREQRQEFWTKTMLTAPNIADRLRASELLGRSEADFTENVNTVGEGLTISVNSPATAQEPKLVKEGA